MEMVQRVTHLGILTVHLLRTSHHVQPQPQPQPQLQRQAAAADILSPKS